VNPWWLISAIRTSFCSVLKSQDYYDTWNYSLFASSLQSTFLAFHDFNTVRQVPARLRAKFAIYDCLVIIIIWRLQQLHGNVRHSNYLLLGKCTVVHTHTATCGWGWWSIPTTTPWPEKKGTNSILGITSSNTGRFSKFFQCHNPLNICDKTIIKFTTTPQTRRYTTLWKTDVRKLVNQRDASHHFVA